MGRPFADIGLWCMCVGGGVGVGASHQLHLVPCAFPFHVPHLDAGRLHSGEQVGDGSQNIRHLGGGGGQGGADTSVVGSAESETGGCVGIPLSLSYQGRQYFDGHVAVLCETLHRLTGRYGRDTERKLLDKRNEKRQAVKRRVLEEMKALLTEKW